MHRVPIRDHKAYLDVMERVLAAWGNHREAAKALGLVRSTFTRHLNGSVRTHIHRRTYETISKRLGGPVSNLEQAQIGFSLGEDHSWASVRREIHAQLDESLGTFEGDIAVRAYDDWLGRELGRLQRCDQVFRELWRHKAHKVHFKKFLKKLTKKEGLPKRSDPRLWIALYRAVEPLRAEAPTMGVEMSWREIHKRNDGKDLGVFLRNALRCEGILLSRDRGLERIRQIESGQRVEEYKVWLAWEDDWEDDRPKIAWE